MQQALFISLFVSVLSASALVACAPAARDKPPASAATIAPPQVSDDAGAPEDAQASLPAADKTLRPKPNSGDPTYYGLLDRTGLNAVIDQGLGRVLARIKLSPAMRSGRFEGFRVTEIDPTWSSAGLFVDDVILRLNEQPIERPEQALLAFESLRVASEVVLELNRAGEKVWLRYGIE
jgi:general secretion pathway protein C